MAELAEEYDAMLYIDDAHGEGVLGDSGRGGIVDHFKLHEKVDFEMGTLSKAFGVIGGYVAGPEEAIDYLRQRGGRPFLFSSAPNPPDVAAAIAAVEILQKSDELVRKLWDNTHFLQNGLRDSATTSATPSTRLRPSCSTTRRGPRSSRGAYTRSTTSSRRPSSTRPSRSEPRG